MRVLRGMPLGKRRQLEQLVAGFLTEQAAASLSTPQQPSDQASQDLTEPANTGPEDASSPPAASGGDRRADEPAHSPTWRSKLANACAWPAGIGMLGGFIVMGVMFESGVDSDATDPRVWVLC